VYSHVNSLIHVQQYLTTLPFSVGYEQAAAEPLKKIVNTTVEVRADVASSTGWLNERGLIEWLVG